MVHEVTLCDQVAIGLGSMAVQKTLVNRVIDNFDARVWNGQKFFNFVSGKLRDCDDTRCAAQHAAGQIKVHAAPQTGGVARSIHVLEQIVHGKDIRATQPARQPEEMRNVHDIAVKAMHDRPKIEIPFDGVVAAGQIDGVEVGRQIAAFRNPVRRSDKEIFAVAVEAREGTAHITSERTNSEFSHAKDVDGYFHSLNLITGARGNTGNSRRAMHSGATSDYIGLPLRSK